MLIISWNINSIGKKFNEVKELIEQYSPDFLCLQKVRCNDNREHFTIDGYMQLSEKPDIGDWSGVVIYVKSSIAETKRIYTPELSFNGHLQAFDCSLFALLNTYVPYGNQQIEGAIDYRKQWDVAYRAFVNDLSSRLPIIICGDLNVVHTQYDTCERKIELARANFTKWERENFNALLADCDLVDAYRILHPTEKAVTYYGAWRHTRLGNRIDYFLVSRSLLPFIKSAEILSDFGTGQSVPITLEISL